MRTNTAKKPATPTRSTSVELLHQRTVAANGAAPLPKTGPSSVFDVPKAPKRKYGSAAASFDPTTVQIHHDVPLPAFNPHAATHGRYRALLDRLKPGDSVELPSAAARALAAASKKAGVRVAVRKIDEERHGVWRLA